MANNQLNDNQNNQNQTQSAGTSNHPEHEPLSFHFGNFKEAIAQVEHQESQSPPENLPSPLSNQPYTPPMLQANTQVTPTQVTPPQQPKQTVKLPLSEEDIEKNAHSKKNDDSIHWLALWCIRQLEMYEKTVKKS